MLKEKSLVRDLAPFLSMTEARGLKATVPNDF